MAGELGPIPERPEVNATEIDGVPTFWLPVPGPLRASLLFRVGRADEPLTHGGISHLVEHLALHSLGERDHELNGFVEAHRTVFLASGTEGEVSGFLTDVTAALSDLRCDRLEAERDVLEVEAVSRGASLAGGLLSWRFGATGVGRTGYPEMGLRWLGEEELHWWAARCFTRGNAALWLTGPPPAGIRLTLPDGLPLPGPVVEPADGAVTPALVRRSANVVAFGVMVGRDRREAMLTRILERRLQRTLRHELAVSYQLSSNVELVDDERAHALVAADVLVQRAEEAVLAGVREFERLAETGPEPEEVRKDVAHLVKFFGEELAGVSWLDDAASRHLFGRGAVARPAGARGRAARLVLGRIGRSGETVGGLHGRGRAGRGSGARVALRA